MTKRSANPHTTARYLTVGAVFGVICMAFMIVLLVVQLRGERVIVSDEEGYVRTYTVPGVRGEIYDCNGVLMVGNATSYDLIYEYGAMPDTRKEVNMALLAVMDAVLTTGNGDKLTENYSVLEGTYPNMTFRKELRDKDSDVYAYYTRFLTRHEKSEEKTDAEDVMKYFTDRYQLYESVYSKEEITTLIRMYYEMERVDFGVYASYTVAKGVNMNLITLLEESNIEGVNFQIREEREYPNPGVASHILGQLGKITAETADYYVEKGYSLNALVGVSGCEAAFEDILHGSDGKMVLRYNDKGELVEKYYEIEPQSGNDVYLTIDMTLQLAAEKGLAENVDMVREADAGAVTVLDPNTGKVLAIASYPTYDLTQFESIDYYNSLLADPNLPLYNRALQGVYAPGSTYKVGVAIAALETGTITAETRQTCTGAYPFYHHPTCLGTHGTVSVVEAIRDSCNVFFYYLGESMGVEAITPYTQKMGLGVASGIELSEKSGIVAGPAYRQENGLSDWQIGDNLSAAIGQSDHGYTPLQLSVYMSTVVNGGTRYRAHLMDSVRAFYTGEVLQQTETEVLDTVEISETTQALLTEAMEKVITENATLKDYFSKVTAQVKVGGKTGTAQVTGKRDYAVFCGFAPLDSPEIVVSCIIEEGASGSRAAYAVAKIMEAYFLKETSSAQ